ncbi:ClpP/crotonase [Cylindrobasidium torrendii FP15055 ss-10]|uniref:ClpP/crotonase n=1 Tax=Cylindrobasidium torrendii FP15055 ss-10 TaxID=1314674 RepID=A0A0D7BIQ9_9AGAR|nr:ClpP/crotonase [Cylindrobasidium torrendii FP15055 ss-10]
MSAVLIDISDGIATITLNRPASLNALTRDDYDAFANGLREIDKREDVVVTVWQATGRWFCAGTDIKDSSTADSADPAAWTVRGRFTQTVAHTAVDCGHALASHSKILVAALNGPVMAFLGHFDFIYCLPSAWLSVPFSLLGIVAEGGSSVSFINRMGTAKATEALLYGRKQTVEQLLHCGFINEVFPASNVDDFHAAVRKRILDDIDGLDHTALLGTRKLLRTALHERNNPDAANLRESYAQAERFASGTPTERFGKIARREIKHKL